jgi:hypothetical protein
VAAFDPSHADGPYYGYRPIYSDGDFATTAYYWISLHSGWLNLGLESNSVLDMLILDQDTLTYTLKDCHRHLLANTASDSSSSPTHEDLLSNDNVPRDDELPNFNPNMSGLLSFDEGGHDLPSDHIPHTQDSIPDHVGYSKVES